MLYQIASNLKCIILIFWYNWLHFFKWFVPVKLLAKDISRETVLVTGAGSGLGRSIATEFARFGCSLVLWDIDTVGLDETKRLVDEIHESIKPKNSGQPESRVCLAYKVDVSDREDVKRSHQLAVADLNSNQDPSFVNERYMSVLVNNAGIFHGLLLEELKDEQIERVFKINVLAHFWTVRATLPDMKQFGKGHIIEIASMGGIFGLHKQVDYCSTKFATRKHVNSNTH